MPTPRFQAVVATANPGKLEEIRALLGGCRIELLSQADFAITPLEETGSTFRDNALIKARHAASQAGLPAIADDSGLAVDVLDGRPGVLSARYAGAHASDDDNIDKLLAELEGVAPEGRGASFRCVAVFLRASDDPLPLIGRGDWRGRILEARRGRGGFGYDPVFLPQGSEGSAAEMTASEKNRKSHRGQAFRELARLLASRDSAQQ